MSSRRLLLAALVVYCAALAVVLLAPTSTDPSMWVREARKLAFQLGLSRDLLTQQRGEFVANVLILMPVSALGSLVWRRTTCRDWTAVAFVLSAMVELAQGLALPGRTASYADVVANALGGLGGAACVALARLATRERRQELH